MQTVNEYIRIDAEDIEQLNVLGAYGWRPVINLGGFNGWLILERPVPEEKWGYVREYYAKYSHSKNLDGKRLERPLPATNS